MSPAPAAKQIPLDCVIAVELDEATNPFSPGNLALHSPLGPVSGTTTYDERKIEFAPDEPLAPGSLHRIVFDGALDLAGNLSPAFESTFETGLESAAAPVMGRMVSPLSDATDVPPDTQIVLEFFI